MQRDWKHRICCYAAPAVLLLVAGVHSYLVETQNLTPWEGGGFAMFSTVDHQYARFLRCYLITPEGEISVRTPSHLDSYVRRLGAMPTQRGGDMLARFLARATWVATDAPADTSGARPAQAAETASYTYHQQWKPAPAPDMRATVEAVRVEVWRFHYDGTQQRVVAEPLLKTTQAP